MTATKTIGIVLFPDFEDLDAIGPREALTMMAKASGGEWSVLLISEDGGPVTSFLGTRYLVDHSYESCPSLDVILVPGGLGTRVEMKNPKHIEFVQRQGRQAAWVTSVCTGALVLHQAGFLEGKRATTHWGSIPELQNLGGNTTVVNDERWVHDGNVITAAGVSAGIDMSLYLISLLKDQATAKRVQQMMEYYPKPPTFEEAPA
ncbi:MAG TPA: DJ-1/PfpI family protein [Dehalococcoidia bacterium]|nr:DJ-1/PfpI family protein [Dehalococcoidia bacterium]